MQNGTSFIDAIYKNPLAVEQEFVILAEGKMMINVCWLLVRLNRFACPAYQAKAMVGFGGTRQQRKAMPDL